LNRKARANQAARPWTCVRPSWPAIDRAKKHFVDGCAGRVGERKRRRLRTAMPAHDGSDGAPFATPSGCLTIESGMARVLAKWCPGRESYATTDTMSRCLSSIWWRERRHSGGCMRDTHSEGGLARKPGVAVSGGAWLGLWSCRGFESVVRYIAKPAISEALFSYRRAA
jgi:hypothetical protein